MNTQEIKINVPDGKKAVYDEATQTIKFVDETTPKSKSFLEFCKNHPRVSGEYYITGAGDIYQDNTNVNRDYTNVTCLEFEEDAEGIRALIQLVRFRDEWNEGWKPDWCKPNGPVFVIHYRGNFAEVGINYEFRRALAFKDKETAELFKDTFIDLIERAKNFI